MYGEFRVAAWIHVCVFGLWEEVGALGGNPGTRNQTHNPLVSAPSHVSQLPFGAAESAVL